MPRKARMYLPGIPCHVISRGNNRTACFFADEDYRFYLACLTDACQAHGVAVHAYVLMTNHVHLLMTPETAIGIPKVLHSIGRRYVQYINKTYRRTGTLWEGRYKASPVDAGHYLLACYRYIELNPVRAKMVDHPGDYPWSSYGVNTGMRPRRQLQPHEVYTRLGLDEQFRCHAYRDLFSTALAPSEVHAVRRAATFSMPLGDNRFREQIEEALGRKVGYACRGRPTTRRKCR